MPLLLRKNPGVASVLSQHPHLEILVDGLGCLLFLGLIFHVSASAYAYLAQAAQRRIKKEASAINGAQEVKQVRR